MIDLTCEFMKISEPEFDWKYLIKNIINEKLLNTVNNRKEFNRCTF